MINNERQATIRQLRTFVKNSRTLNQIEFERLMGQLQAGGELDPLQLEQELNASGSGNQAGWALLNNRPWLGLMVALLALLLAIGSFIAMAVIFPGYDGADARIRSDIDLVNTRVAALALVPHPTETRPPSQPTLKPTVTLPVTPTAPTQTPTPISVSFPQVFTGHIYRQGSDTGIPGITVHLKASQDQTCAGQDLKTGISDQDGNYSISVELPADARVCLVIDTLEPWNHFTDTAAAEGWRKDNENNPHSPSLTGANQANGDNRFYLEIVRTFSGNIVDAGGNGLPGIKVQLEWKTDTSKDWATTGIEDTSGDGGAFTLEWTGTEPEAYYKIAQTVPKGSAQKEIKPFISGDWETVETGLESSKPIKETKFDGVVFINEKAAVVPTINLPTPNPTAIPISATAEPTFETHVTRSDADINLYQGDSEGVPITAKFSQGKTVSIKIFRNSQNSATKRFKVQFQLYVDKNRIETEDKINRISKGTPLYWPNSPIEVGNVPGGKGTTLPVISSIVNEQTSLVIIEGWLAAEDLPQ